MQAENFKKQRVRDNAGQFNYLIQAKLDFLLGEQKNINFSIGGMYEFTRYKNWGTTSALFNAQNNSQSQINTWRVNARWQHRILRIVLKRFVINKILHRSETFLDKRFHLERHQNPFFQQSSAHRRECLVEDLQQGDSVLVGRMDEFEVADGETVEPNIQLLFNPVYFVDMLNFVILCFAQIVKGSTRRNDAVRVAR